MLNLDPGILDQDKIRLTRRKRLLKLLLIPCIIFLLVALFFFRTGLYNILFNSSLGGGNQDLAEFATSFQKAGNLVEPYLPYYNSGYLSLIEAETAEDLSYAEKEFRESLKNNPPESIFCSINGNLSYSLELQGDILAEAKQYNEALVFYDKAEVILYENNCAAKEDGETGTDELSEVAKERIIKKRAQTVASANNEANPDSTEGGESVTEISDDDLKNIDKLNVNSIEGGVQMFRQRISDKSTSNTRALGI